MCREKRAFTIFCQLKSLLFKILDLTRIFSSLVFVCLCKEVHKLCRYALRDATIYL